MSSDKEEPLLLEPRIEELDTGSLSIYDIAEYFVERSYFVFLDSRLQQGRLGRYSFIAFEPFLIFKSKGRGVRRTQPMSRCAAAADKGRFSRPKGVSINKSFGSPEPFFKRVLAAGGKKENVFDVLGRLLQKYRIPSGFGQGISPFVGGGIGYFSYEMGRQIEALPVTTRDVMGIPECYICFYNAVIICDHEKDKIYLSFFDPDCDCGISSFEQLKEEILSVRPGLYLGRGVSSGWRAPRRGELLSLFKSDLGKQEYMAAVNRIKEYILAGDVYQVNMTRRFETEVEGIPPWQLYKRLMHINPAPFAAYMNFEGVTVVSSSPERFLEIRDRYLEARPIKGTVKRGGSAVEDGKNKNFLLHDEKNRAELAMIVDLLRNDMGRVCEIGSVNVKAFPELETYASVHHLVSTITGQLKKGKNVIDVLKAAFPGGSITGAPKIRAMEIIDELEPVERGVYTGSIGYLGFNGCSDLNIVIRTIVICGGKAHIQAGGGIVADSIDREEYEESLLKAQKLFNAFIKE